MCTKKWNKTNCKRIANRCKSKSEFQQKYSSAYNASLKNNWIDEFFPESKTHRGRIFWTKETCRIEVKKYSSISEFSKKSSRAYRVALDNGWLEEFGFKTSHMTRKKFTFEECKEVGLASGGRTNFIKVNPAMYRWCQTKGWLDQIFGIKNYRTKEVCQEIASHYKTPNHFKKNAPMMYKKSLENNWINEFFPGYFKEVSKEKKSVSEKSIREMIIDFVVANGPQTKKNLYKVMLTVAGQNIERKAWGVCWMDNVSTGTSVFMPSYNDPRFLVPVRDFNYKTVKYDIAPEFKEKKDISDILDENSKKINHCKMYHYKMACKAGTCKNFKLKYSRSYKICSKKGWLKEFFGGNYHKVLTTANCESLG